jgi:glycine oxidase
VSTTQADVAIVGGGIIGLATAWKLARQGLRVTVLDPDPAHAATRAAAGMLAPVSEIEHGESDQLRLATESLARYPAFVAELEAATGHDVGLRGEGTLILATDAGDRELLAELHQFQTALGLTAALLTSRECRDLEPVLSPEIRCGLLVSSDHSVDNRRLAAALLRGIETAGVTLTRERVAAVTTTGGAATGVELASGNGVEARYVVAAAGPWTAELGGIPESDTAQVRPVKGQILRLRQTAFAPLPQHTLRGLVNGHDIYLIPRVDGELVVGATVEEAGFDTTIRAGAVREILRDARAVMPSLDELELVETMAALRPGSPDNLPSIGTTSIDGLIVATGHFRNGILLAAVTADLVAALITGTATDVERGLLDLVTPQRFSRVESPA